MNKMIENTIENLKNNGFQVCYFETGEEAKSAVLNEIPPEYSVGFGGSVTAKDLGIYEALKKRGNTLYWHWMPQEGESGSDILRKAASTDIYISGTNAITENGSLVNIDATCNRISSILFGHKKVIILAGVNKITRTYEEAIIRIKNIVSPANAKRLNRNTPCAKTGKCMNCDSPERICRATLTLDRQPGGQPITIYLINENLGF